MSTTINCQDCKAQWEIPADEIPLLVQDDTLVVTKGTYGTLRYFGLCETCKFGYKKRQVVAEDEFVKLYRVRDRIRTLYPDWTMEQVCARTVELLNDPLNEENPAYRAYLLEWVPRPDIEAIAA